MPQLWLYPGSEKSKYRLVAGGSLAMKVEEETSGRSRLIMIPGAASMDIEHLRALIEWQEEITRNQLRKLGPKPEPGHSKEEIAGALKELLASRKRRKETGNPRYF